ncbi:MAG: DUF1874 domain-containing protein [Nitrososphaeria archaeon]
MTTYIGNSFTLSMLKPQQLLEGVTITARRITLEEVKEKLGGQFVSCIGHGSTAEFISQLLGIKIPMNRIQIKLEKEDELIVIQVMERIEEGKVLSREEIESMYKNEKIHFFLVRIV